MRFRVVSVYILLWTTVATVVNAQELRINSSAGNSAAIIHAQYNSNASYDKPAFYGSSVPRPYWGIGGRFEGGYIGVEGTSQVSGEGGYRYGGKFTAAGGNSNYAVYGFVPEGGYAGYFSGDVYVTGSFWNPSDARLKLNVRDMQSGLARILRLRPRTYQFRRNEFPKLVLPGGDQSGLIAQEVQEVLPEFVHEVRLPKDKNEQSSISSVLAVDYVRLIPVLIKAIQEQQAEIDELKAQLGKR